MSKTYFGMAVSNGGWWLSIDQVEQDCSLIMWATDALKTLEKTCIWSYMGGYYSSFSALEARISFLINHNNMV